MKKTYTISLLITILFFSLVLNTCSNNNSISKQSYTKLSPLERRGILSQKSYHPEDANKELSRPSEVHSLPFTLNYSWYGSPVVNLEINGQNLKMVVDTGCTHNYLYKSGIEKLYKTEENFFIQNGTFDWYKKEHIDNNKNLKNASQEKIIKKIKKDLKKGKIYTRTDLSENNRNQKYYYYATSEQTVNGQNIDGVLGSDFLLLYKTVTFDFKENYLYLDTPVMEGNILPMMMNKYNNFYIYFLYQGKKELGLLDTGSYTFSPRHNIGNGDAVYDIDSDLFNQHARKKIKQISPAIWTFTDIKIGDIEYDLIKGQYAYTTDSGFNYGAQTQFYYINNLGTEFFFDHIIQFDFENMNFIIK